MPLLDGRMMVDRTPEGVPSQQILQLQPSITKTPILKSEDDQQKTEPRLTRRDNAHKGQGTTTGLTTIPGLCSAIDTNHVWYF